MTRASALVVVLISVAASASAQTAKPAAESDAIAVLTREIRALRQEIAETARASLRLQLLTARIQAQEQRIIYLDRQRAEAVTRRSSAEQARNAIATQIQTFAGGDASKLTAEQRRDMEPMLAMLKKQVATQDSIVAQLETEENDAANALAQEQGRWADLNQRLEDLERLLK
jgi:ATP-dependent Clp protease ATP-binding subunit ClpA